MVYYEKPKNWIKYEPSGIMMQLADAKACLMALKSLPLQKRWVEALQQIQLKREVAGTSRIEGATFSDRELDEAMKESAEELFTRSQKQAAAAARTYIWIASLPLDMPINGDLICKIHFHIVTGADDDHCAPGRVRREGVNVNFGTPKHRGAEGGDECEETYSEFTKALTGSYQEHDLIIQAIAAHYHLASMHPFQDGNGRSARALEALMLQRAGLRDSSFIAMSNYYYDEKTQYLTLLADVRQRDHDLTHFLQFALKGISLQCQRLLKEIHQNIAKALVRNVASEMLGRLKTKRKAVLAKRQFHILDHLLDTNEESIEIDQLMQMASGTYGKLQNPSGAFIRDLINLRHLGAILITRGTDQRILVSVRLEWPSQITETEFFKKLKTLPKIKTLAFLDAT